ncbi:MAG: nucleoside 2-deoxyribosyltransferase [Alkalibacterium sp.]|nr:nucleoside 2-deoxyribosyltransferase [Alkalibacterium sp.]
MTKRIYFASPLFTEMEQSYNTHVVSKIRQAFAERIEIYLPQENAAINDKSNYADSIQIADGDNAYLEKADILIAILDGVTIDAGVASEIGYFYSMNKPIIGVYSDIRQGAGANKAKIEALDVIAESPFSYINLYTVGLVKKRGNVVRNSDELIEEIKALL